MIKPEGINIFTCENGYGMETVSFTDDGEHIIKRYIGDLEYVLSMSRKFFMEEPNEFSQ